MSSKVTDLQEVSQQEKILQMRVQGKDIPEIARALLISEVSVRNSLNEAWTRASAQINKYAELLVAFDVQRLETLIDRMMIKALEEDSMNAIDRVIKLINLKSKLVQKEQARSIAVNISGNIHHEHEQVFTVNSDDYAQAVQELMKDPSLMADHPKLPQIQAKLAAMSITRGTPSMDNIVEGTFEESNELPAFDENDEFGFSELVD